MLDGFRYRPKRDTVGVSGVVVAAAVLVIAAFGVRGTI